MLNIIHKFQLIMWKNLLIRKRHWLLTAFEIAIPILLFLLVAYVRGQIPDLGRQEYNETTIYKPNTMKDILQDFPAKTVVLYSPNEPFHNKLMETVRLKLAIPNGFVYGYDSERALNYNITQIAKDNPDEIILAVVFDESTKGGTPKKLKYSIRTHSNSWDTVNIFPFFIIPGPMKSYQTYLTTGFFPMQMALDAAYIEMVSTKSFSELPYKVLVQEFPYPPYTKDVGFEDVYRIILPVIAVLSFLFLCPSLLKRVVEEKQSGIKELMKLMGLQSWMLWIGWLFHALVSNLLSITVIVILLKMPWSSDEGSVPVIQHCSGIILWLFLTLYVITGICFCFFLSTLFQRPTIAMSVGEVAWLLSYFVPHAYSSDPKLGFPIKLLMALFPNMAMNFGFSTIATFEGRGVGLNLGNFFEVASGNPNDISMGTVFGMFILDILFYSILTWYIDSVMPGQYGLARPWYFPFTLSYWLNRKVEHSDSANNLTIKDMKNYEEPSSHLIPGIKIRSLRKQYGNKMAVDGLTMDFYKGEITALLGHNGAGKTTTMSILTGMFSPTSGEVSINDWSLRTQLNKIRECLGLCPQHNMLFTDLTVLEHLIFFSKLKGASCSEAYDESQKLLNTLQLSNKASCMASQLSGGMQRKLSLAIALVGNSKVLMLDEPTSGMDPEARRQVWDILLQMRHPDKTIIITTHFMEEADVLGDRIAIMDHGQLQCFGTSMYLKKRYGAGYQLTVLKSDRTNTENVTAVIANHIPEVKMKNENSTLISYSLPTTQNDKLPDMFKSLEELKDQSSIVGIGLSVTTLEEVFLRVGQIVEEDSVDSKKHHLSDDTVDGQYEKLLNDDRNQGLALQWDQFKALTFKKFLYAKRKWLYFSILSIIPICCIILTIYFCQHSSDATMDEPPLTTTLDIYGENVLFYSNSPKGKETSQIQAIYASSLPKKTGHPVDNVTSEILKVGVENIVKYREMLLIAAEFSETEIRAMYSSIPLHNLPITWNLVINAVLKQLQGSDYAITTVNHPLDDPTGDPNDVSQDTRTMQIVMYWLIMFPLGLMFAVGAYIHFPLTERVSKAKQLQLMTGLRPYLYWLSCYTFDLFLYLGVVLISIIAILITDSSGMFSGINEIGIILLIIMLYGLSGILYSYIISIIRPTVAGGFSFLLITNLLIGMFAVIAVYAMIFSGSAYWGHIGNILNYILSLIPHYTVSMACLKFSKQAVENSNCKQLSPELRDIFCLSGHPPSASLKKCCEMNCTIGQKCTESLSYLKGEDGISFQLIYLFIDIFFLFGVIVLIESVQYYKLLDVILKYICKKQDDRSSRRDSDVEKESLRVDNCLSQSNVQEDNLLVHKLEKRYGLSHFAVRGISFGVHSGECFGLLGVNGAGKTTTFKMLTGDEAPTKGDAMANHYKLSGNRRNYLSQFGYCPQFDAINESLTGRELLNVFGRLRGVPQVKLTAEVNKWLHNLGLQGGGSDYADRLCGTYSGGNKRKLSTAMALIGEPPIVLLDEPTSGVDPISRRNLWNVLGKIQKQSIVLTSHSMEECEALCNRLAIMVNGQFVCVGTVQYLKQRFGQGYTVLLKLRSGVSEVPVNNLKNIIESEFPCEVKDEHEGLLHYHITDPKVKWFALFSSMEDIKQRSNGLVEDYTISETTLEQVFLSFARQQRNTANDDQPNDEPEIPAIAAV